LSEEDCRQRFEAIIRSDGDLTRLLRRLRSIDLPQWRLVAGCLYQTVWNVLTGRPRGWGIQDYDVSYFDSDDLSWHAEDAVIRRAIAVTADCAGPVQVRNQARVHLWFAGRFGVPYPPLRCAEDVAAPFGLEDLFAMVIRPNRALDNASSHAQKAAKAQAIWPEVVVIPWDCGSSQVEARPMGRTLSKGADKRC
jgi:uncharacterized protein